MTYTLQQSTVALVQPHEVMMVRKLSPGAARLWLFTNRPDLPEGARDDLLAMCNELWVTRVKGSSANEENWTTLRSQFITAAWMCGASWYQIGQLFNIRRETVRAASLRIMSNADRSALRKNNIVSWERLSAMRDAFIQLFDADPMALKITPVIRIADQLWSLSEQLGDESEHSAYDQLDASATSPE